MLLMLLTCPSRQGQKDLFAGFRKEGDARTLHTHAQQVVERIVDHLNVVDGELGDAVVPVLVRCYDAVVVEVDHLEIGIYEHLHRLGKLVVPPAQAALLHRLLELVHRDLAVLQQLLFGTGPGTQHRERLSVSGEGARVV